MSAREGRCYVEDLGSINGTQVNGVRISGVTELRHGDTVGVGQVVLALVVRKGPLAQGAAPQDAPTQRMDALPEALLSRPPRVSPSEASVTQASSPPSGSPVDGKTFSPGGRSEFEAAERTAGNGQCPGDDPETRIRVRPPSLHDAEALRPGPDGETRTGASPASSIDLVETRILDAMGRAGRSGHSSEAGLASASDAESTPVVRPSAAQRALASERRSGAKPGLASTPAHADPPERVVDRARRRREANESLGKLLLFHWSELSRRTRYALMATGAAVVLVASVSTGVALWPSSAAKPQGPEPTQLSTQPIPDSFGLGDGVTWKRRDLKRFDFFFNTPTRAVAVLHYQARDIAPDEVSISVNGVLQGSVPPDTTSSEEREIEQVLASRDLKRNARNVLVFDDLRNPPGEDNWRIWGLWLEVIPIPELPQDQLLASAKEYAARGKQMSDQRDVGTSNLFQAWRNYRFAWLTLEAVDPKPELYALVRYQLASIGRELDQQCGVMMLAARKAYALHDRRKAKEVLEEVNAYFPTTEHRCHNLALEKLNQFDL